jgi:hypothetical protein
LVGELPPKMPLTRPVSNPLGDGAAVAVLVCRFAVAGTTRPLGVVVSVVVVDFGVRMGAKRFVIAGSAAVSSAAADAVFVVESLVATVRLLVFFGADVFAGPADALLGLLCVALPEFADAPALPVSAAATPYPVSIAAPTPSATAKPLTRSKCFAAHILSSWREGD